MTRVYLDIVADLFHIGHLNLFKKAKLLDTDVYLIVGIHSDVSVESYKRVPIIKQEQRYEIVRNCRLVNEVIENAPLVITENFLKDNKIDYVAHGDDINEELKKQHKIPLELGVVKYVPYTSGISTTEIIKRIKNGNY
mgnify:FL=1